MTSVATATQSKLPVKIGIGVLLGMMVATCLYLASWWWTGLVCAAAMVVLYEAFWLNAATLTTPVRLGAVLLLVTGVLSGLAAAIWMMNLDTPYAREIILVCALCSVMTDSFAQLTGMFRYWFATRFQPRRNVAVKGTFYPTISPNKSLFGAIWGYIGGVFVAVTVLDSVYESAWQLPLDYALMAHVLLTIPTISIAGDLSESVVKRLLRIKDFSALLPGHGGVLDRLDSLAPSVLWAASALYFGFTEWHWWVWAVMTAVVFGPPFWARHVRSTQQPSSN